MGHMHVVGLRLPQPHLHVVCGSVHHGLNVDGQDSTTLDRRDTGYSGIRSRLWLVESPLLLNSTSTIAS